MKEKKNLCKEVEDGMIEIFQFDAGWLIENGGLLICCICLGGGHSQCKRVSVTTG